MLYYSSMKKKKVYGPSPRVDQSHLRRLLDEAVLNHNQMAKELGVSVPTVVRTMRALGWKSVKGHGSPMEKNYFWNGGRCRDADGYILLKRPGHPYANNSGYVREHRLVMEQKLGRYLLPTETVHHKDEDHANNAIDNLELYPTNGEHLREHMLDGSIPRDPITGRLVKKMQSPSRLRRQRQATPNHCLSKSDDRA